MAEYVWLPHDELVWVPALLVDCEGGLATYTTVHGESLQISTSRVQPEQLERVSEHSMKVPGVSNLVLLDEFGEGAVIHQLRSRYEASLIYTNIGTILVSVNPYRLLPIYAAAQIDAYQAAASAGPVALAALDPHVYSIAAEAFSKLYDTEDDSPTVKRNQAIIISGESGAGKTEVCKTCLQYLSEVAGSVSGVESMIMQSNPILEALGNAKTLRNNNSSRFGKWMAISFEPVSPSGGSGRRIIAARIVSYLLEQSRVTVQSKAERSYHIFYQMCKGLPADIRAKFGMLPAEEYHYLNQSGTYTIDGVDDESDFECTRKAMHELRFEESRVESIWRLLIGVLQIGQLRPEPNPMKSDVSLIANKADLELATATLGLPSPDVLSSALCYRSVTIRGSISMIPLNVTEVAANRDALAKTIYAKLFDYVIVQMNAVLFAGGDQTPQAQKTDQQKRSERSIGLLDIFGFEIFDINLFEQCCINYANEKLQGHFNQYIFKLEAAEYLAEGIDVAQITFVDNLDCLALIESRPGMGAASMQGIFSMLDEELMVPRGSDQSLITKMHAAFASKGKEHKHYAVVKKAPELFVIRHYAAEVAYSSEGLLAKNKNKLNDNLEQLMSGGSSNLQLLVDIFNIGVDAEAKKAPVAAAAAAASSAPMARRSGHSTLSSPSNASKKKEATLAFQFYSQLSDLMATLHACSPQFIRCLKPNSIKAAGVFDTKMVLNQMSYAGLFEAIRIRKSGYPFRKVLAEFGARYRVCLSKSEIVEYAKRTAVDVTAGVAYLLAALTPQHLTAGQYQIGATKVYMKTSQRNLIDALRDAHLTKWAVQIQAFWRMYQAKKLLARLKLVHAKCVTTLAGDCTEEALSKLLEQARDAGHQRYLFILVRVESTHTALGEVVRVSALLAEALANNELDALEGALEQATRLQRTHDAVVPSDFSGNISLVRTLGVRVTEATKQRDYLLEVQRLQQALRAAILSECIVDLEQSLTAATSFGLDANLDVMVQATSLLRHLHAEEALMESLRQATVARDVAQLERLLTEVQTKHVTLDAARKEDMSRAMSTMQEAYDDQVRSLMTPDGEAQLRKVLLSKVRSLGYADLVSRIETFLQEADAERARVAAEAAQLREEARRAEEARLAQERAHLAAADKARLEEEDRARIAAEDAAIAAAEAAAAAERERTVDAPPLPPSDSDHSSMPPPPSEDSLPPPPAPDDSHDALAIPVPPPSMPSPAPDAPGATLTFIGPPPTLTEHPIDQELDAAVTKRSLAALERALASAKAASYNSRLVRIAANLVTNLQAESRIRSDLRAATNRVDVISCKALIKAATAIGFLVDPLIEEARSIAYGLSPADLLALRIQKALPQGNADDLRRLLQEAADLKPAPLTQNEWVEQAKDWLAAHLARGAFAASEGDLDAYRNIDWCTTLRLNRSKAIQPSVYATFVNSRDKSPLNEVQFPPLRRAGNYAKGNYLSKSSLKEKRLVHQTDGIPRSLVKLSTEYCGGKEKSKAIKVQAKQVFKNMRGYMRDTYHSYPATLAYDIVMSGVTQPLLRDEIFCLLIKQTTKNPSPDSMLHGLKLFYLCLATFSPAAALVPTIWSHLAAFAHPTLPDDVALGLQLPDDVASSCFVAMQHVDSLTRAHIPVKPPTMADIESMTLGTLAKRSGRFENTIAAASASRPVVHEHDDDLPAPPPSMT